MDKERAQFILHSFRPDGADAADQDFAEALQLAAEDRELGEWLADERAADAEFATALCEVKIPDDLRMHILTVMRGEKPTDPALDVEMDALLSEALTDVEPPAGLREQILNAMYVQENQCETQDLGGEDASVPENVTPIASGRSWLRNISWAAAVVLGGFLALQMDLSKKEPQTAASADPQDNELGKRVSSKEVQHVAGNILNSKLTLDVMHPKSSEVNTWLVSRELPAPTALPRGLRGLQVMGCREIQLENEMSASLLCFVKTDGGMVHLVVINNTFIKDHDLPSMSELTTKDCYHCKETNWNIIRWRDRENTYFLFDKKSETEEVELIEYF